MDERQAKAEESDRNPVHRAVQGRVLLGAEALEHRVRGHPAPVSALLADHKEEDEGYDVVAEGRDALSLLARGIDKLFL